MTIGAIIALVRDFVIVAAVGFIIYLLINYGKEMTTISDMAAVNKQLGENAKQVAQWRQEQTDANAKRETEVRELAATIGAQRAPVFVQSGPAKAGACPVPGHPAAAAGEPAASGAADSRPRGDSGAVNVRDAINGFEVKYETALSDCRTVLAQWPR